MKVIIKLEVSDEDRKVIRQLVLGKRSGKATRDDVKEFVTNLVVRRIEQHEREEFQAKPLPAGDLDRLVTGNLRDGLVIERPARRVSKLDAAAAAEPTTVCKHCGQWKQDHGGAGYSCPPIKAKRFTTTFEA